MRNLFFLLFTLFLSCEKKDSKFIRNLEETNFDISKIVIKKAAKNGADSTLLFNKSTLYFGEKINQNLPRQGELSIDNLKTYFYYSVNNTQSEFSNGKKTTNNLFFKSILPEFYNPENQLNYQIYLDGEALLNLNNNTIVGVVVFTNNYREIRYTINIHFN
jgi:hypothetical protein